MHSSGACLNDFKPAGRNTRARDFSFALSLAKRKETANAPAAHYVSITHTPFDTPVSTRRRITLPPLDILTASRHRERGRRCNLRAAAAPIKLPPLNCLSDSEVITDADITDSGCIRRRAFPLSPAHGELLKAGSTMTRARVRSRTYTSRCRPAGVRRRQAYRVAAGQKTIKPGYHPGRRFHHFNFPPSVHPRR